MQVTYKLEESDLVPYSRLVANRTPLAWLHVVLPVALFAAMLILSTLTIKPFTGITPVIGLSPLVTSWPVIIYPALIRRKVGKRFEEIWGPLGVYTLIWVTEGIGVQSAAGEAAYFWRAIKQVTADSAYFYLWLGKTDAMIVPKRAFKSQAEAWTFYDQAKAYWEGQYAPDSWPPPPTSPGRETNAP